MNIEQGRAKTIAALKDRRVEVSPNDPPYQPPAGWRTMTVEDLIPGKVCSYAYLDQKTLTSVMVTGLNYSGRGSTRKILVRFMHLAEVTVYDENSNPTIELSRSMQNFDDRFVVTRTLYSMLTDEPQAAAGE